MDPVDALVSKALKYAVRMHRGQKRENKRTTDHVYHSIQVMAYLEQYGVEDPIVLAAAVLHDVVEDTPATHAEIQELFGKAVSDVVREVSDDMTLPKLERKQLQESEIGSKSLEARLIKIAAKWSNTTDLLTDPPVGWTTVQRNGYIKWSEQVCKNACSPGDVPTELRKAIQCHFVELDDCVLDAYYDSMRE